MSASPRSSSSLAVDTRRTTLLQEAQAYKKLIFVKKKLFCFGNDRLYFVPQLSTLSSSQCARYGKSMKAMPRIEVSTLAFGMARKC